MSFLFSSPPRRRLGIRVGKIRGHTQFVAKPGVAGELGPLSYVTLSPPGQRREHYQPRVGAPLGGLVRNDAHHKSSDLPPHLGVQVRVDADDAVGLPMAEPVPVVRLERTYGDGDPGIGKRDTLLPMRLHRHPWPRGRWLAQRSRRDLPVYIHR